MRARQKARQELRAGPLGDRAVARRRLEHAIGRRDQAPRERDALGLVGVEQVRVRAPADHRGELPREVHRVAEPGVHPLAADGAVNVAGVAEEEHAAARKLSATR